MATIQKIAKRAGVSTATVSRVMNQNGYVSEASLKKVKRAMVDVGYDPVDRLHRRGPSGSSSAKLKCRSFTILCTSGDPLSQTMTGMALMEGLTEGVRAAGANLVVDYVESDRSIPQCLTGKGADGVFLLGPALSEKQAEYAKQIPVVWLLQGGDGEYGDRVQPHHWNAGVLSYRELEARGCSTFCCIGSPCRSTQPQYWHTRAQGFLHAAQCGGKTCRTIYSEEIGQNNDNEACQKAAAAVLDEFVEISPMPEGMFVANSLGPHIHAEMKERGIVPMKDVLMVAGDIRVCGNFLTPEPITLDILPKQLGMLAVDAMLQQIRKTGDSIRVTHLLQPQIASKT